MKPALTPMCGFKFQSEQPAPQKAAKAKGPKAPPQKIDPKYLTAARELRDRWMEQVNAGVAELPAPRGKYDVSRAVPAAPMTTASLKALPQAA